MSRPSPSASAKDYKDIIKFGNNHVLWISKPDVNNVYKWKELKSSYNIYKIYTMINSENKKMKTRYDKLIKIIQSLKKKIKLEYINYFLNNLNILADDNNDEYPSNEYLGDDGDYARYSVDDDLKKLMEVNNSSYYFIINDMDVYEYFTSRELFIYGTCAGGKIDPQVKKIIQDAFKDYKIQFQFIYNNSYLITIKDK